MKRTTISLAAILALTLTLGIGTVLAPATVRVVPVDAPGTLGTAGSGAALVTLGSAGTFTVPVNFTIHVTGAGSAGNIQGIFILNHTLASKLDGPSLQFVDTGLAGCVAGSCSGPQAGAPGTLLAKSGPGTNVYWAYSTSISGGVGPDHVFDGSLPATTYYNFSYVFNGPITKSAGPVTAWHLINVTFTVPAGSVSTQSPAEFIIVGAGPSLSATGANDFTAPYATPWSGATNITVIPEFFFGTLAAVLLPLLALAGYMYFRSSKQTPAVSLNT
jgi:hypothetical protein